jgi:MFS transporter, Spinster family, sphingosine-1-phosphate transporter
MGLGYFVAGWLNEIFGWRAMFMMLGLPGLLPAALARFTLREPRRDTSLRQQTAVHTVQPSVKEVFVTLSANVTFRHLLLFFSVVYFFGYGILQWQPAFFIRSYGLKSGVLGSWFAAIYGLGGILGTYIGGELASRFAANQERLQLRAMALLYCGCGVASTLVYLVASRYAAFALMAAGAVASAATIGPLFATIQTLVPQRMRAVSIAIIYLFANLVGLGLGPLAAGALSDVLRPTWGEESLRVALLILCPGYLWGGWHLWRASRTVAQDLSAAQAASMTTPRGNPTPCANQPI